MSSKIIPAIDFESLQREIFRSIFNNCSTPESTKSKPLQGLKKAKPILASTPTLTKFDSKNSSKKVKKELKFSSAYKAKKRNLENIIKSIKGKVSRSTVKKENIFKTPVKTIAVSNKKPSTGRPRGRPRKVEQTVERFENEKI